MCCLVLFVVYLCMLLFVLLSVVVLCVVCVLRACVCVCCVNCVMCVVFLSLFNIMYVYVLLWCVRFDVDVSVMRCVVVVYVAVSSCFVHALIAVCVFMFC